jgi:hypothetical protein
MIFINKSADYSANNIGKVDIPIIIDETAQTIMAAYSKTLTKDQQAAFSILISGLKDSGIYDKIEYMYLPCLAGNVSEAFYDAKNGVSQDVSDTSKYGQYSIGQYGLYSVYDSSKTYTQFAMPLERTTQGCTIASIVHMGSTPSAYFWFLKDATSNLGVCFTMNGSPRCEIELIMNGNDRVKGIIYNLEDNAHHATQSITAESSPWLPSSENVVGKVEGQDLSLTSAITSDVSLSKNNKFYLGGYSYYGPTFITKNNSIDFVAICPNLESTYCEDDSTITMADMLDSLVGSFKNAFFA